MSKHHPDQRILKKVRITAWYDPLTFWEDVLTEAEIDAYRLAGYIVTEMTP